MSAKNGNVTSAQRKTHSYIGGESHIYQNKKSVSKFDEITDSFNSIGNTSRFSNLPKFELKPNAAIQREPIRITPANPIVPTPPEPIELPKEVIVDKNWKQKVFTPLNAVIGVVFFTSLYGILKFTKIIK